MSFESSGERSFTARSPGGFEFGVQGWTWGDPKPTSITFFLDNTAMVCDQYGRQIRRAVLNDGRELRFADTPPEASRDRTYAARAHFATHAQVLAALAAEGINWMAYEVRWVTKNNERRQRGGLTMADAAKQQSRLVQEGHQTVAVMREVMCAGWPQLPYEDLKKLTELPPTPIEELRKIQDMELRRDALRFKREVDGAREKELQEVADE